MKITNDNGLLMADEHCLGYLLIHPEHGVYDASIGKVDVTTEDAQAHNQLFDKMMIEGLDKCPVGKGAYFYIDHRKKTVKTWMDVDLGKIDSKNGKTFTFNRNGMTFKGTDNSADGECVFFKRIS